jgi:hypothetical protein
MVGAIEPKLDRSSDDTLFVDVWACRRAGLPPGVAKPLDGVADLEPNIGHPPGRGALLPRASAGLSEAALSSDVAMVSLRLRIPACRSCDRLKFSRSASCLSRGLTQDLVHRDGRLRRERPTSSRASWKRSRRRAAIVDQESTRRWRRPAGREPDGGSLREGRGAPSVNPLSGSNVPEERPHQGVRT